MLWRLAAGKFTGAPRDYLIALGTQILDTHYNWWGQLILNTRLVPYTDWTKITVMKDGATASSSNFDGSLEGSLEGSLNAASAAQSQHTLGTADSCHDTLNAQ
eukprot:276449-Pelagomonas_calceolata.AAC.2